MAFSYLNKDNVFTKYKDAKTYTDKLTLPFPEFERLARNRPSDDIDENLPKTTDGTTASIVRKTPKRVVQQLPTGVVETDDDEDWLPIVAQDIYTNKILPYANEDFDLIQKCWANIESGLSFGFGLSYSPFVNHDGYFCPDMVLPYWGDIAIQPGKKSGYSSGYIFIRSWWQREDIESLIDQEKALASSAKKRGDKYEPTWDVAALKDIMNAETAKDSEGQTPMEKDRGVETSAIEIVTGFQKGVKAKFFTFNPETKKIIRTKVNKDPRGKMPLDWLYGDIDGSNPLGRGIIELIGGLQNLIDSDMQMYQFNRALLLAPPVMKRGNFPKTRIVYRPNHIIDVGSDPNAKVEPLQIDSSAIAKYPELYGLQKSQLLNLVSSPDTSIGSDVGNPGFGKTPTALNQQKANLSVDDNYIRKQFEAWFGNWSETAINLYFAERTGKEVLTLSDETVEKLKDLAAKEKFDLNLLNGNKLLIDYDTATPALRFRVDASTSKMQDDAKQIESLTGLLGAINENPLISQMITTFYPEKIAGAWNSMVAASGVENPELLTIDLDDFKEKQEAMKQQAAQQEMAQSQEAQPMEALPETTDPNAEFMKYIEALNLPEEVLATILQLVEAGATPEEIMQQMGAVNG